MSKEQEGNPLVGDTIEAAWEIAIGSKVAVTDNVVSCNTTLLRKENESAKIIQKERRSTYIVNLSILIEAITINPIVKQ